MADRHRAEAVQGVDVVASYAFEGEAVQAAAAFAVGQALAVQGVVPLAADLKHKDRKILGLRCTGEVVAYFTLKG